MSSLTTRIRHNLVGLRMPRALEGLDHTLGKLEQGEVTAIEAIDDLLNEEFSSREGRRIAMALTTARLTPIKTLESFDFTFQPSLDRDRIIALAEIEFINRAEVVHFLGPPGTGKSHLATLRREERLQGTLGGSHRSSNKGGTRRTLGRENTLPCPHRPIDCR